MSILHTMQLGGELKSLVPPLTSNTSASATVGVAYGSAYTSGMEAYIAFRNNVAIDTGWWASGGGDKALGFHFNVKTEVRAIAFAFSSSTNSGNTGITLQYSDDGTNYTSVNATPTTQRVIVADVGAHYYWRVLVANTGVAYCGNLVFLGY